jgi:hypothetical protein
MYLRLTYTQWIVKIFCPSELVCGWKTSLSTQRISLTTAQRQDFWMYKQQRIYLNWIKISSTFLYIDRVFKAWTYFVWECVRGKRILTFSPSRVSPEFMPVTSWYRFFLIKHTLVTTFGTKCWFILLAFKWLSQRWYLVLNQFYQVNSLVLT